MTNFTPGQFAAHLAKLVAIAPVAKETVLTVIADGIAEKAKAMIGEYHAAEGPFPAWAPLAASTEAAKARMGYPANSPLLATGEMRDSIGMHVSPEGAEVGTSSEKAVWQEYGTDRIPPRPFMGPAAFTSEQRDGLEVMTAVGAWVSGKRYTPKLKIEQS